MKTFAHCLAFALAAVLMIGAFDAAAETLAETRALCRAAHERRFPKDAGPDDAGERYEWDRYQAIHNDARKDCQIFIDARADFLGNASTTHTIPSLQADLATCEASVALMETARTVLAADKEACRIASTQLACTNNMGYPGECVSDGGTDGGP